MKKLLLVLICLFVFFEVKSKEIVLQCDGVLEDRDISFHHPYQKIQSKSSREHTEIYYLNERKKYLGNYDKKERKSGSKKRLLKLIKRKFKKSDDKFIYNIKYFHGSYEERKSVLDFTSNDCRPEEIWNEIIFLKRYTGKLRHTTIRYECKPQYDDVPRMTWETIFIGNCKKVDRKF